MDKYENLDNIRKRNHTVEVTLQSGEYKGKVRTTIGGNCFGLDILNCVDEDFIYYINDYELIDCFIELLGEDSDGEEWFRYRLKDDEGNICEGEEECRYFSKMVVGINIVRCEIIKD